MIKKKYYQAWVVSCYPEKVDSDGFILRLDLDDPDFSARGGQFVVLQALVRGSQWGRPITIADIDGSVITLLIKVVGPNTAAYSRLRPGDTLEVLGPQGSPLPIDWSLGSYILAGGGSGIDALFLPARELMNEGKDVMLLLAAKDDSQLYGEDLLIKYGFPFQSITETGPGKTGFATDLLEEKLKKDHGLSQVIVCGPGPMLKKAHDLCMQYGNSCIVICEEIMACGMGGCKGCRIQIWDDGNDEKKVVNRRVCTNGPGFTSNSIVWEKFIKVPPIWMINNKPLPPETPVDVSTDLGPLKLSSPIITAAGTVHEGLIDGSVSLDGIGAIMPKGVSLEPRSGNEMPRVFELPWSMINAIGMENEGVKVFKNGLLMHLLKLGLPVIVNIFGNSIEEYAQVAERLDDSGISALEINISCPNTSEGGMVIGIVPEMTVRVVEAVRRATSLPLITKLSPNVTRIADIARAAVNAGTDILSAINTVLAMEIDVWTRSPVVANVYGGYSGPSIKPIALRCVHEVVSAVDVPVIGIGGITNGKDVAAFTQVGASAVEVGTVLFNNRRAIPVMLEGLKKVLLANGCVSYRQMIGSFMKEI